MGSFSDVVYRNCVWCGTKDITMSMPWNIGKVRGSMAGTRSWAVVVCPRCAGATLLALEPTSWSGHTGVPIPPNTPVSVTKEYPGGPETSDIDHLPPDVAEFYETAVRVLGAGVPDAAAVQLRKTLEAAAAHVGVKSKTLYESVQKMIDQGLITQSFSGLLTHVRTIGNLGAHYTDTRLSAEEVARALAFTTQILRNLFEVPGELAALAAETPADEENPSE